MNKWVTWIVGVLVILAVIGFVTQRREGFDGYPKQPNYNKVIYSGLAETAITRI
jgi:hypothetical protein